MRRKRIGILISLVVIPLLLPIGLQAHVHYDLLDGGWLEVRDGVKILHVSGSYYEMGYQHGFLLKEEAHETQRAFLEYISEISSYEQMLEIWNTVQPYVPSCYLEEMHGLADGGQIPFETIAACYMTILFIDMQCFTYVAWNSATADGGLYHFRSLDFPLRIRDPMSGKYIQENSILIVRTPLDGVKSLLPSIAGAINFYQGINANHIAIGVQVCWSSEETLRGIPVMFKTQRVLDVAENMQDAIEIFTGNNTLGWNFIVSDAKENTACAIEITANQSYTGTWDDPVEGNAPFWQIEEIVRRTNFFLHPELASTQRSTYDPSGINGFLRLFNNEPWFLVWRKYKSMSEEIERQRRDINVTSGMSLMRKVYTGRTDVVMFLFIHLYKNSILCDFQQWGVCPQTGEFVISFADAKRYAHEAELHHFNVYELFA